MKNVRTILATTDCSQASAVGVRHALEIAQRDGAKVILFNVADMMEGVLNQAGSEAKFKRPEKIIEEHEKTTTAFVNNQFPELASQVEMEIVAELGLPHRRIVEKAEELGADLIVMSTHGRSGVRRMFLGSTTEQVVRHSACPVLTVRYREAKAA